jgi:hypothetical protein
VRKGGNIDVFMSRKCHVTLSSVSVKGDGLRRSPLIE